MLYNTTNGQDHNKLLMLYNMSVASRDVHETFQAETETRPETQRSETETRPRRWAFCPRRDRDRDVPAPETLAETCGEKIKHHKIN